MGCPGCHNRYLFYCELHRWVVVSNLLRVEEVPQINKDCYSTLSHCNRGSVRCCKTHRRQPVIVRFYSEHLLIHSTQRLAKLPSCAQLDVQQRASSSIRTGNRAEPLSALLKNCTHPDVVEHSQGCQQFRKPYGSDFAWDLRVQSPTIVQQLSTRVVRRQLSHGPPEGRSTRVVRRQLSHGPPQRVGGLKRSTPGLLIASHADRIIAFLSSSARNCQAAFPKGRSPPA